jgi:hypothetical protein
VLIGPVCDPEGWEYVGLEENKTFIQLMVCFIFSCGLIQSAKGKYTTCSELTPQSRFLLGKLIICQIVKRFAAFYETRKFITAFGWPRNLSLS